MTYDDMTKARDLAVVKELHDRKRDLEAALAAVRTEWKEAMLAAREHGVTVSDISREIGVTAPNLFRVMKSD
jgi:DNA-directed RNA polymerase specialized sigma24 family protein